SLSAIARADSLPAAIPAPAAATPVAPELRRSTHERAARDRDQERDESCFSLYERSMPEVTKGRKQKSESRNRSRTITRPFLLSTFCFLPSSRGRRREPRPRRG